jgi:hypothetical protein
MNMNTTYVAKSLVDIANDFAERGKNCREMAKHCQIRRDAVRLHGRADAWENAADLLRRSAVRSDESNTVSF